MSGVVVGSSVDREVIVWFVSSDDSDFFLAKGILWKKHDINTDFGTFDTIYNWGCSSNGRAPASHAGGKGIDAPLLHRFFANAIHDARVGQRVALHSIPINTLT